MIIDYLILVKLILAHFLVDFCFQSNTCVQQKRKGVQKYHIIHVLGHAVLAYCLVGCWKAWYIIPPVVGISHFFIDWWKSKKKESFFYFIIDQALHLIMILFLWLFISGQTGMMCEVFYKLLVNQSFWACLLGFVIVLKPTSVLLNIVTRKWEDERGINGLENAGQWIGYLERILILVFMLLSVYEAVGFLLAAKSIYRFGELKEASDIKKTEYIMIGTFLSFTIAIVVGLVIKAIV